MTHLTQLVGRVRELVLWLATALTTRLAAARLTPQRGASAIEWVIITAIVVVILGVVGVIISDLIEEQANSIDITIPGDD